jgi:hypothetical protein
MIKTLTLVLVMGLSTSLSAQFLLRTEKVTDKQWRRTDQILINLDTMPDIQFAFIRHHRGLGKMKTITFDIGDGYKWQLVDKNSKPLEADNLIDGFNLLYKLNWVFYSSIDNITVIEGLGTNANDLLYKRRETK